MNFFEQQDKARSSTWKLVLYFALAVVSIVILTNFVLLTAYFYLQQGHAATLQEALLNPKFWFISSLLVVGGVGLGSLFRYFNLRGGGRSVAELVGARELSMYTEDLNEKRLINVVEEMAIASGTPMPTVFVMDGEMGINAFVAGYKPTEAVLVVTQGTLENLNRDELQGVIGHEYSHIFNGDMRLNIRLMAIVAGILVIGQLGYFLYRSAVYSSYARRRSSDEGKAAAASIALGVSLIVVGYVGVFFARLIKASISRQREYLADASSVQFTRNPDGIARALMKIEMQGSRLENNHNEDVSHLCFGQAMGFFFKGLSTHPPLDQRIAKLDPNGDIASKLAKDMKREAELAEQAKTEEAVERSKEPHDFVGSATMIAAATAAGAAMGRSRIPRVEASAETVVKSIGNPTPDHLDYAHRLWEKVPENVKNMLHCPGTVQKAIYGLIVAQEKDQSNRVILLQSIVDKGASVDIAHVANVIAKLPRQTHLPIIDIAIPALKKLSPEEIKTFLENTEKLILADKKFTLFELSLLTILESHLSSDAEKVERVQFTTMKHIQPELSYVLQCVLRTSGENQEDQRIAFAKITTDFYGKALGFGEEKLTIKKLRKAIKRLQLASPSLKQSIIKACAEAVLFDKKVKIAEIELLRALCESLDCPMPPLITI